MGKILITTIISCHECFYCSEGNTKEQDRCFHEENPGGDDCAVIGNADEIPSWCPLEDYKGESVQRAPAKIKTTGKIIFEEIGRLSEEIDDMETAISYLGTTKCLIASKILNKVREEKCKEYNKLIYAEYELVKGETDEKKPTD